MGHFLDDQELQIHGQRQLREGNEPKSTELRIYEVLIEILETLRRIEHQRKY